MVWHRRTFVEVVVLGLVAPLAGIIIMSVAGAIVLSVVSMPHPLTLHQDKGHKALAVIVVFDMVLCPCIAGFVYGLKRRFPLCVAPVFVGWIVGWLAYGALMGSLVSPHTRSLRPGVTPWPWLNCLVTIGELLLISLLPALATMWGQQWRLRRTL